MTRFTDAELEAMRIADAQIDNAIAERQREYRQANKDAIAEKKRRRPRP